MHSLAALHVQALTSCLACTCTCACACTCARNMCMNHTSCLARRHARTCAWRAAGQPRRAGAHAYRRPPSDDYSLPCSATLPVLRSTCALTLYAFLLTPCSLLLTPYSLPLTSHLVALTSDFLLLTPYLSPLRSTVCSRPHSSLRPQPGSGSSTAHQL